ncbi:MAG: ribosome silencing factor [Bacteroidetes bacterium]|nr:ribosome silencing factor [Bacteroidota bacterium]MCB0854004.1 ribosome silencing factor [Bacteroidota bacterium]
MTKILLDAKAISDIAVKGLQEIKGKDIIRMDLTGTSGAVTDYFIICTGTSDRHVASLAESVLKEMKEHGERPISTEGLQHGEWVLIDFVNVVVHIFQQEKRNFYRLEALWGDGEFERFEDVS